MLGYLQYESKVAKYLTRLLWASFDLVCKIMDYINFMDSVCNMHKLSLIFSSNVTRICRFPTVERALQKLARGLWEGTCSGSH